MTPPLRYRRRPKSKIADKAKRVGALLEKDQANTRGLSARRQSLQATSLLKTCAAGIQFRDHIDSGATVFAHACKLGFEGIVSKDRTRPYRSGPSETWLKVKNPTAPSASPVSRNAMHRRDHQRLRRLLGAIG